MNKLNTIVLAFLVGIIASCAKQSTPMGGPVDKDPPKLQESFPKNETLNIKPEKLTLIFDEYVKLDNPSKGIVITPRINKDEVIFSSNKNIITVDLNQELEENTTYVFDFQKAVVDISEENPAENLKLVFSTGSSIDSLTLEGKVNYLFPDNRIEYKNVLVGVYPVSDTTDIFTGPPYYLSQVDSSGNFKISNIKNGSYFAYAWNDENGSIKAEYKSEAYDFLLDTLHLAENLSNLEFNLSKADFTPIRILRTGNYGRNFDVILNKNPVSIDIKNESKLIDYQYTTSDKRIRIYPINSITDSTQFSIQLTDSVGFKVDTLIWAKFPESERKPDKLTLTANSGKNFYRQLEMELTFNKPISKVNTDSLYVQYDSAGIIRIEPSMFHFTDSARRDLLKISISIPDSISKEIFTLKAADSTFLDWENQYNEAVLSANYKKIKRESLADEISGTIIGASPPFMVQLMDSKDEVSRELYLPTSNTYSFKLLEPGNYKIRVIQDSNGNKRWDPANFPQRRKAEQVFYYTNPETKNELVIRAGWTLTEQNITKGKQN